MQESQIVTWSKKASFFCHVLAILPLLIGGLVYALRDTYLPYHAAATSHDWQTLEPGVQVLFKAMLNGAGGLMLLTSFILIVLLIIPFRQNERWSFWAIPLIGISAMLITIRAAVFVDVNTPANPPWLALLIVITLFISGFFLSYKKS
jgi:hypothetical protein